MTLPRVYSAITSIMLELSHDGISKGQTNEHDGYRYRGVDDVYNRLSPLLAQHKLCILPRVLERGMVDRRDRHGNLLIGVNLKVAFDLVSAEDGSRHVIEVYGEALDSGDKATSKAMSAAFKYAVLQAFCVPVGGRDDADAKSHRLLDVPVIMEPVQGWEQWQADLLDVVRVCETGEALDRLQDTNRGLLRLVSTERPEIYAAIGEAVRSRRDEVSAKKRLPAAHGKGRRNAPSHQVETHG